MRSLQASNHLPLSSGVPTHVEFAAERFGTRLDKQQLLKKF
jgi:hypothetical protein